MIEMKFGMGQHMNELPPDIVTKQLMVNYLHLHAHKANQD